jgi:hypothetical protein
MEDLQDGYIACSYIFGDVLEIVCFRAIETSDLVCRNLYCVL